MTVKMSAKLYLSGGGLPPSTFCWVALIRPMSGPY